jgi:creatinine amidohydrolase
VVYRYAELSPQELKARLESKAVAIQPIGALEWHGPHLPLGLDGIVADGFCEQLARRTGAVLLPQLWLPITTLPHEYSLDVRPELATQVWLSMLLRLHDAGFKAVCCISGHYAQGHMVCLYQTALAANMTRPDLLVLAASPLELLGDDSLLDHAGKWEAAQLLTMRPDLVHNELLPEELRTPEVAVLGGDPREGTIEEGRRVLDKALDAWSTWVAKLADGHPQEELRAFLQGRIASYEDYTSRYYRGSWDEAIRRWWGELTSPEAASQ